MVYHKSLCLFTCSGSQSVGKVRKTGPPQRLQDDIRICDATKLQKTRKRNGEIKAISGMARSCPAKSPFGQFMSVLYGPFYARLTIDFFCIFMHYIAFGYFEFRFIYIF